MCPTVGELKTLVASAARIGRGQADASDAPLRAKLTRSQTSLLTAAVERAMTRTEPLDVKRWLRYADATCSRAGLLLAGDLDAARTVLASERQLPGELSPRDKLAELIEFFLGDGYAGLRARLGTSVPASMAPPPMQESAPTSLPAPPPLPSLRPPWTKR